MHRHGLKIVRVRTNSCRLDRRTFIIRRIHFLDPAPNGLDRRRRPAPSRPAGRACQTLTTAEAVRKLRRLHSCTPWTADGLARPAGFNQFSRLTTIGIELRNHAAPLPHLHEPSEAFSLFVILIPIIAGRVLRATRALRAGLDPKFPSALLRRLFPPETLNRSRFPKLHSGPSTQR